MDLRARAELLPYLVSGHLLARQLTGDWLSPDHVVESTTLWMRRNGAGADVMQRVMLSSRALEVAQVLETHNCPYSHLTWSSHCSAKICGLISGRKPRGAIYQHCLTRLVLLGGSSWL